jgi:hypothetical protein
LQAVFQEFMPNNAQTKEMFSPLIHGFSFQNEFSGIPFLFHRYPKSYRWIHRLFFRKSSYGLCGGMCFTALDYFHAKQSLPTLTSPPAVGSLLHSHLFQRQNNTYGFLGRVVAKFGLWSFLSDAQLQRKTSKEFSKIQRSLDAQQPVVLGLVYVHISESIAIWMNHQVIAYRYEMNANGGTVYLYDPNYPGSEDIAIELIKTRHGFQCLQKNLRTRSSVPVRGFFEVPYRSSFPPSA